MLLKFRGADTVDVTQDPNTTFFTDPARDGFNVLNHNNVFCPTAGDANRTFTLYGRAFSQSDHHGTKKSRWATVTASGEPPPRIRLVKQT